MTTFRTLAVSIQFDNGSTIEEAGANLLALSTTYSVDQDSAGCTVELRAYPDDIDLRYPMYVYARIDGGTLGDAILFNGEVTAIDTAAPGKVTVTGADYLARLGLAWSREDRSYADADSSSVVQNLVEASGIDVSLTDIQAPSGWNVGVIAPVTLVAGDTPRELIRRLDDAEPLWRTWTRPNGAIRRRPMETSASVATIAYPGADVLAANWRYHLDGLVNACRVTGAVYNDVPIDELYQELSAYVPDPPAYITHPLDSYLIEDPTRALAVATAIVTALNTTRGDGSITVPLRHDIEPGDTITFIAPDLGIDWDVYVHSVQHRISESECATTLGIRLPAARL